MASPFPSLSSVEGDSYIPMSPRNFTFLSANCRAESSSSVCPLMCQPIEIAPPPIHRHLKPRLRRGENNFRTVCEKTNLGFLFFITASVACELISILWKDLLTFTFLIFCHDKNHRHQSILLGFYLTHQHKAVYLIMQWKNNDFKNAFHKSIFFRSSALPDSFFRTTFCCNYSFKSLLACIIRKCNSSPLILFKMADEAIKNVCKHRVSCRSVDLFHFLGVKTKIAKMVKLTD